MIICGNTLRQHFAATLFLSAIIILTKGVTAYQLAPMVINFYFSLIASLLFLAGGLYRGDSFSLPRSSYWVFGGLAFAAIGYNESFVRAIGTASNPAYPQAIVAASVIITASLAVIFFWG